MNKRIVICADGTWNRPEEDLTEDTPTNVLRFARAIKPVGTDGVPQQVFYDWGLGSYHSKIVAGITGKGIQKNIMDNYRYIVQNYSPGDALYLFGFSRGAYTIRSLCGLINNCGILKRPDARLIERAFKHYKRRGKRYSPSGDNSVSFRKEYSHRNSQGVHFVGAWDTVGAMGIPISFLGLFDDKDEFYDTEIGRNVSFARHALAIDEYRKDFEPTVWIPKPDDVDMKQVWFLGAHSDVGGSYKPDSDGTLLSDIPLKWMSKEASGAGLEFERNLARSANPNPLAKLHKSRKKFFLLKKKFKRKIKHELKYKGKRIDVPVLIHKSVKERWDQDGSYDPKHLEEYLEEYGWPTPLER